MTNYEKLENRFRQISHLNHVRSIVSWDEAVMMPQGGSPHRNAATAELVSVIEDLIRDEEVGEWLAGVNVNELCDWKRANVEEMRRLYIEKTAIPADLSRRFVMATLNSEQAWRKFRVENNWRDFLPMFREVWQLSREMIHHLQPKLGLAAYDTALSLYSPGLSTAVVERLFGEIKSFLPSLIQTVVEKQKSERVLLPEGPFPMAAQKALGLELMAAVGFNMDHGRLDESFHPFCGGTARDVRITTRYKENEFISSLMGVLHESGHGIYEQNLPEEWLTQPVGNACGMAVHESQSLMMEMQVCRSREFIEFAQPLIVKHMGPFTKNPESLSAENLYRLVTRVRPGLIRVDADEVTYPAHVILRFEIERDLLEDRWPLDELPEVWNTKMQQYLGLSTLGNDRDGCMQDVHWPSGAIGYFPAYTFGAVIAAQLFSGIMKSQPDARQRIAHGDFSAVHDWLKQHVWGHGMVHSTLRLVENASGPLKAEAFEKHLRARYL